MTTPSSGPRYGRINAPMLQSWLALKPEDDGPFWALNLMHYRETADYADGRATTLSGREADEQYTPLESLSGVGATVVFAADVERVTAGDGLAWDRVGIVRYPSRRAFLEMQQREDFRRQHVHKDAGMQFTIVISTLPVLPFEGATEHHDLVELRLSGEASADLADEAPAGAGRFSVEGVIVGDERAWGDVSFRWLPSDEHPDTAADSPVTDDPTRYVLLLRPALDRLTSSVVEPPAGPAGGGTATSAS